MRLLNNPTSLKALVSASLILLLCFLGYWNIQNYDRIKFELRKDLTDQMSLATNDYKDSIVQVIFSSIDKDSFHFDIQINDLAVSFNEDPDSFDRRPKGSHNFPYKVRPNVISHDHIGPESIEITTIGENGESDSTITVIIDQESDRKVVVWSSDVSLTKEVQIEFDSVEGKELDGDTLRGTYWFEEHPELYLDDSLLSSRLGKLKHIYPEQYPNLYKRIDSIYSERLAVEDINLDYKITMIDRKDDLTPLPDMAIALEYGDIFGTGRAYAVFNDYKSYIFKKMTSYIMMSLLLFSVMAFSFYFILNSWLSQLRLTKVKNEFISNMTHELKTPISTVGVAIEALENFGGMDDAKKRSEYLDISKHELNRLTILVDKVLKMSTLEDGAEEMVKSEVDIQSLTESTLHSMKLHFEKNQVTLNYEIEGEDFLVNGDKIHLTNVLYNLIDNAIKYSGPNPIINVNLSAQSNQLNLSISDNGPGIPKEYQSKVFDRFFRVPSDDIHNVKGHGLGLHYVKTVVSNHNGSVQVKSSKGEGATFIITLPRKHD